MQLLLEDVFSLTKLFLVKLTIVFADYRRYYYTAHALEIYFNCNYNSDVKYPIRHRIASEVSLWIDPFFTIVSD